MEDEKRRSVAKSEPALAIGRWQRVVLWIVAGATILFVAFIVLTPAFGRVAVPSIKGNMRNDARQISFAAQQYMLEYRTESVALVYDPATGEIGEPLRPFVARIAKGYAPVPERLTKTATFQLGHPKVGVMTFTAEGQIVTNAPPGS